MLHTQTPRCRRSPLAHAALLALAPTLMLAAVGPAHAVSYEWANSSGPLPGSWAHALNWVGGVRPVSAATTELIFPNSLASSSNDLQNDFAFKAVRAFAGGSPGAGTIGGLTLQPSGSAPEILVGALGVLTLNAGLTGSTAFGKTGGGMLTLGGDNSGYSGLVTVSAGRLSASASKAVNSGMHFTVDPGAFLQLAGTQTLGSLAGGGAVLLGGNSTLAVNSGTFSSRTFSGDLSGLGGLGKTGTGTSKFSGTASYAGATTVAGGLLALEGAKFSGGASLTVSSGARVLLNGAGTEWSLIGDLAAGTGGTPSANPALVLVQGGAKLSHRALRLGDAGQQGQVALSGAATQWTSSGAWTVGHLAPARCCWPMASPAHCRRRWPRARGPWVN